MIIPMLKKKKLTKIRKYEKLLLLVYIHKKKTKLITMTIMVLISIPNYEFSHLMHTHTQTIFFLLQTLFLCYFHQINNNGQFNKRPLLSVILNYVYKVICVYY